MASREALLRAAQQFTSSDSEGSDRDTSGDSRDRSPARTSQKHDKKRKKKHSKQKHHKKHKRSEHEKIQDFERRAAAIGATSLIPRLPASLGSLAATVAGGTGDAVLDTAGDPNNTTFESLYGGSVPRYNRVDPFNLVHKARFSWQAQLQQPDADAGNTRTDR